MVAEVHARLTERLLGERHPHGHIDDDLVPPVLAARGLREVRQRATRRGHRVRDEVPARAGDHLTSPGVEQAGEVDAA